MEVPMSASKPGPRGLDNWVWGGEWGTLLEHQEQLECEMGREGVLQVRNGCHSSVFPQSVYLNNFI